MLDVAFQTAVLLGGLIGLLWVAGHVDQWIQKRRGVQPDASGRIEDGHLAKLVLAMIAIGFFVLMAVGGNPGHPVDGC